MVLEGYGNEADKSHKEKRSSYALESGVWYDGVYKIEKCWRKIGVQCVSDMARLYTDAFHSCYDDMIVNMAKEHFKFLNKYLTTFNGSTHEADAIGAAKEEAAVAIIEYVKSADLYQVSSLQKLQDSA
ncbi:hypothetical protein ZWY2020_056676 [Hordeum vulgare]|nr:hypothetical protein ZWY2020_056676 [Hordeum vulgare]